MSHITNLDVQELYKRYSAKSKEDFLGNWRRDYAKADLQKTTWLNRTIINLESLEHIVKYPNITKIKNFIAEIICSLLPKALKASVNAYKQRNNEICCFHWHISEVTNILRLFKSVFGPDDAVDIFSVDEKAPLYFGKKDGFWSITLRTKDKDKEGCGWVNTLRLTNSSIVHLVEEIGIENGKPSMISETEIKVFDGDKLLKNKNGEFYFDHFAALVRNHLNSIAAPVP